MKDTAASALASRAALRRSVVYRLKAAGIHLSLSAIVFAVALYLILVHWYPGFHFGVDGGWQGVRLMAFVDLVLGPMLTLVICSPFKARRLIAFDLTGIGLAQLAALAWGFYAVHGQHPVAVSFRDATFQPVTVAPLRAESYDLARLATLSDRRPALVYVAQPAGADEEARVALQMMIGAVMPHEDPMFFRRFDAHWPEVRAHAVDAAQRAKDSPAFAASLRTFLEARGARAGDFLYFPYEGRYGACTLAFTADGVPVEALGCQPY